VVAVATAVEHDLVDAGSLGPLGQQLAGLGRLGGLVASAGTEAASIVEAEARVWPSVSSTTCTKMCRVERLTTRRGRPAVPVTRLRTRR